MAIEIRASRVLRPGSLADRAARATELPGLEPEALVCFLLLSVVSSGFLTFLFLESPSSAVCALVLANVRWVRKAMSAAAWRRTGDA